MSETAYITVEEADAYAEGEVEASAWSALTAEQQAALLVRASDEIDGCRWQGRKYESTQHRAFPRVHDEGCLLQVYGVWDWDAEANQAVVPEAVKRACFLQALADADNAREARAADRHDGVAGQSAGGVSETYDAARPMPILCRRADVLLRRYQLRTGQIV